MNFLKNTVRNSLTVVSQFPSSLMLFLVRFFPAVVFWQSGRTKMDGWDINESALYLFQEEYRLPLIDPLFAARMAAVAEHLLPVLLILGFATRFSAAALLGMTLVIQLFVYPDAWPTHGTWAALFLLVIVQGPGKISLDHFLFGDRFKTGK